MKLPFVDHVGMRIEEQRDGLSRCTLPVEDYHFNSAGVVHGGVLFTLAGNQDAGERLVADNLVHFKSALDVEKGNITVPGDCPSVSRTRSSIL